MNLYVADWTIVALFMLLLVGVAVYSRRYTRSVADFLTASRCAGRYVMCISHGVAAASAISIVGMFEKSYKAGFGAAWWEMMLLPVGLFASLSGYIIYRYRETRAMTMAQFFEMRYSRRFRVFCGILAWAVGAINMGIFPAVTARFFIYFCGLPHAYQFMRCEISTFASVMMLELSLALLLTLSGGMVVVMITDFVEGTFCNIAFIVILGVLMWRFDWNHITTGLQAASSDASMINPFRMGSHDFSVGFFLMSLITSIYSMRAWQGGQGFNAVARNAHEAKMAGIIGMWRGLIRGLLLMMLPICAFVFLHHPDFAAAAGQVQAVLNTIDNPQVREQMTVSVALTQMLPAGVLGLLTATMVAAAISTDSSYLHSWGSIFVQDVILPFRRHAFTQRQQLWLLRLSVAFVAVFVFAFSLLFRQSDYILMFFASTSALYLGGAGAVIVGGLYWRHGSTRGAWAAMIVGALASAAGIILQQCWTSLQPSLLAMFPNSDLLARHPMKFPWNGMQVFCVAMICAIAAYVGLSLWDWLMRREPACNMDRLLHRCQYALQGEPKAAPPTGLKALMPSVEFSRSDRFLHYSLIAWNLGWYALFLIVIVYQLVRGLSDGWWMGFWRFKVWLTVVLGTLTTTWFLWGGFHDIVDLFRTLRNQTRDLSEDGRVCPVEQRPTAAIHAAKQALVEQVAGAGRAQISGPKQR